MTVEILLRALISFYSFMDCASVIELQTLTDSGTVEPRENKLP